MLEEQLREKMRSYLDTRDMKPTAFAKEFGRMSIAKTLYDWFNGGTITLRTWDALDKYMQEHEA